MLIFRSQIDSYSYLLLFHFMNIIPICKHCNFRNIFPIHKYFSKYWWISYLNIEYIYKIWKYLTMVLFARWVFQWKIYIKKERKEEEKRRKGYIYFRYSWMICKYFHSDEYYSYSSPQVLRVANYSYSYLCRSCLRKSISIKSIYGKITLRWILPERQKW